MEKQDKQLIDIIKSKDGEIIELRKKLVNAQRFSRKLEELVNNKPEQEDV